VSLCESKLNSLLRNPGAGNSRRSGTTQRNSDMPHYKIRTSLTHPLRIDEVAAGSTDGRIGITFCPGKHGPSVSGYSWERSLAADLDVVTAWRADVVVTLIEQHEFAMLGVEELGTAVKCRGIAWYHLPIVDLSTPDAHFESVWTNSGPELLGILRQGGRVLVHCRGGLGRAGTIAARMLIELGVPPKDAVNRVRAARTGAIETAGQLQYVLNLVPLHKAVA